MIAANKKLTSRRRGFTLLEVIIVVTLFSILAAYTLLGMREQMHLTTLQQYLQDLDTQGSRIMQALTNQFRPAILPIPLEVDQESDKSDKAEIFEYLYPENGGFNSAEGNAWMAALVNGVDSIAFVAPVAADGGSDVFDDPKVPESGKEWKGGHMIVGQRRSSGVALDGEFEFHGDANDKFIITKTDPACSLLRVSPAELAKDEVGGAENITAWPDALYNTSYPESNLTTNAFSVIRYVPVREGGTPISIAENDNAENGIGVDLNGDGELSATFNIGRLQLVHVGEKHWVRDQNGSAPLKPINDAPHEIIDLSADFVLREENPQDPTGPSAEPIFKLVKFSIDAISDGNPTGQIPWDGDGVPALVVKVNLFNLHGNQILRTRAPHQQRNYLNREFETVLTLQNMAH